MVEQGLLNFENKTSIHDIWDSIPIEAKKNVLNKFAEVLHNSIQETNKKEVNTNEQTQQ